MVWLHMAIIKLYQDVLKTDILIVFDWNWPKSVAVAAF